MKRTAAIVAVGLAGLIAGATLPTVAQTRLKTITQVLVGAGLTGGGTGPTVSVGLASGGVNSSHVADGSLQVADFSANAQEALRGPQGPKGDTGAQGPIGPTGATGPAGAPAPRPAILHTALAADLAIPSRREVTLAALTQTVAVSERSLLRAYAQAAFVDSRDNPKVRLGIFLDGRRIAAGYGDTEAPSAGQPQLVGGAATQRAIWVEPGTHTIEVRLFSEPLYDSGVNGTTILGSPGDDGVSFLNVEVQ
jgi:hypothetical protein